MKAVRLSFVLLILVMALFFLARNIPSLPSLKSLFTGKPLRIQSTPILVQSIHELAELGTYAAFDEVVVDSMKGDPAALAWKNITGTTINPFSSGIARFVLIAKGQVKAGIRLNDISEESIRISGDTAFLSLPPAGILDVIVNPSGFEVFTESGDWSEAEITRLKMKARDQIRDRALQRGILRKAEDRAKILMEQFLLKSGFKQSRVSIRT